MLAKALYVRFWHCVGRVLRFGCALRRVDETPVLATWVDIALGRNPGQRDRHSASFTKGLGGIGGCVVVAQWFRKLEAVSYSRWSVHASVPCLVKIQ